MRESELNHQSRKQGKLRTHRNKTKLVSGDETNMYYWFKKKEKHDYKVAVNPNQCIYNLIV